MEAQDKQKQVIRRKSDWKILSFNERKSEYQRRDLSAFKVGSLTSRSTCMELNFVSSTASEVIRKSEISNYLYDPIFPHDVIEDLLPSTHSNPFSSKIETVPSFMEDLIAQVSMAEYSLTTFLQLNAFQVLYHANTTEIDSKKFHSCVDNVSPVALVMFFKEELVLGITYTKQLNSTLKDQRDSAAGYFNIWKSELNSCIITDNTIVYKENGFQIGLEPLFSLSMGEVKNSVCHMRIGNNKKSFVDSMFPNWKEMMEGIVVLKLA